MIDKQNILSLLDLYISHFPAEAQSIQLFADFMRHVEEGNLINRKNFGGHITTSAFIIDQRRSEMLLLKHKSLNRWLQPGGHVENTDNSLVESALREAVEETGISADELMHSPAGDIAAMPFDIDSHYIPANNKKMEAGHYHHDLRYVFIYNGARDNEFNADEATGMRWVPFAELDAMFTAVVEKIRHHLSL